MQLSIASIKSVINQKKTAIITVAIILGSVFAALLPASMSAKSDIFVDVHYKGTMDGSYKRPYNNIQDALDKAKSKHRNVFVKNGVYRENIEIPKDVELIGESRSGVVIRGKRDDREVVKMNDDTLITKMTIMKGDRGILVNENAKATISRCNIIENDKDGIKAKRASTDKEHILTVEDSYIAHNGWDGIYSEKRRVSIKHTEILENRKDGLDLDGGSEGYLEDNHLRDNKGVGAKLNVDESNLWFDRNTFYGSGKDGVEIESRGRKGTIGFDRCKFYKNDDYAIARVEKADFSDSDWNSSVIIKSNNLYWNNHDGDISPIIDVK